MNPGDIESMTRAADRYAPVFARLSAEARDSGYTLFAAFYDRADSALNSTMEEDALDYEQLVTEDIRGIPANVSPKMKARNERLRANGFRVTSSEGMPYIEKDLAWVGPRFYRYLSPVMKAYVEQLRAEADNRFADDAAIMVTSKEFVERTIWWENFARGHRAFTLYGEAERMRKLYLTTLLEGVDNTSVLDYESNGLSTYYDSAWSYLATRYPKSEAAALIVPFHAAWRRSDTAAAGSLLRTYRQQGRVLDYGSDSDD
ncbi:MAG: hypothetical protein EOO11_18505 [Chitinophagaceae bacterium]|nr:MAG: hypothetical protein EOO11_18505 [Chitinophagaceae bacterium]